MYTVLYRHKNNRDVAVEVLTIFQPHGKDYARIKVRWWNIGPKCFDMRIESWLQLADPDLKVKERRKYPMKTWRNDWVLYHMNKPYLDQIGGD